MKQNIIVIGNGMVGYKFLEILVESGKSSMFNIQVFGDEPIHAYDRVQLSSYFTKRDPATLALSTKDWYAEHNIQLHLNERITSIDRKQKTILSEKNLSYSYDILVLATGSSAFVPPVFRSSLAGVFVYRTIDDLNKIIEFSGQSKKAAVIGGGLLGLEAAKAMCDLNLETYVIEYNDRLMPRQIDADGSDLLIQKITDLGVTVLTKKNTARLHGTSQICGLEFDDGSYIEVDMVVVSAGITPNDNLARSCELKIGPRGGVIVDSTMRTNDPSIFAIGEIALYENMIYGLVAPGYSMASVAVSQILGDQDQLFTGADMSTKLKLMGVDVGSFGSPFLEPSTCKTFVQKNELTGTYQKLVLSQDGKFLLGGIMVGDTRDYYSFLGMVKNKIPVSESTIPPFGDNDKKEGTADSTTALICSCNNVNLGDIVDAVKKGCHDIPSLKKCTKAGTGCGGCIPLVDMHLKKTLQEEGQSVSKALCEHFNHSRQELYQITKVKKLTSFTDILRECGTGQGCEICKPAVASILASIHNAMILEHDTIQDTNDRFLANIQRGGTYSIVPRVPGGEITPEKLIALGEIAKKYNLYCKITGGQRVDLFGAEVNDLPAIWSELIEHDFESGHAYGKALRTVKSCVGSTWCRYGVQDSTGFAIRIEQRYKGIRAPHKIKSACSGCIRECAEAQNKDFGLVATEKGWNLYVGGNGGAKPQHGQLLAGDIDEETCIKYIDRYLMFYIQTADRLTRTATWLNQLDGGIEGLKKIIIDDSLGLAASLEADMQHLVNTYACEWKEVVNDPEKQKKFKHFVNSDEKSDHIKWMIERGQKRPANWQHPDESSSSDNSRKETLAS